MKKIAILTCLNSVGNNCTGASCLAAFNNRSGAFQQYQDEDLQLAAFFQCNGCDKDFQNMDGMKEKIDRILKIRPDAVHLGVCTLKKDAGRCGNIEAMTDIFRAHGLSVINGTHNSSRLQDIGTPVWKS